MIAITRSAIASFTPAHAPGAISPFASPATVDGTTRTWTQRMCLPSGAREGSIAVGWPTTMPGSAGSRPSIASA